MMMVDERERRKKTNFTLVSHFREADVPLCSRGKDFWLYSSVLYLN